VQTIVGTEWLVEAEDCDPERLRDETVLRGIFDSIVRDLDLKTIGEVWHTFPDEGGVTGLIALTESHLACHTYPEHRTATFNLYCCRLRPEWPWQERLAEVLGSKKVTISRVGRGGSAPARFAIGETAGGVR
jgi:S-adenosylmethionine decarboxylase